MKKLFTLVFAFLALMISANAQTLLSESFDNGTLPTGWTTVDNDGDGFNWTLSTNPSSIPTHTGDGAILSYSYDNDSYTALTPDNWLITPQITIPANGAILEWWVAAQDASYPEEHYEVMISTTNATPTSFTSVFEETLSSDEYAQKTISLASYAGQTIYIAFVHNEVSDMFAMKLDDISVTAAPTSPTISSNIESYNFGSVIYPGTYNTTANVVGYNLTTGITATTAAPFAVSADGTTYGTTASLPAAGGTLYIQFTPTAGGADTGDVTLASTGATDVTIALTATAVDCSAGITIPFSYDFNTGDYPPQCWTVNDPENFNALEISETDNGITFLAVDRLVTPEIHDANNDSLLLSFMYSSELQSLDYPTSFKVGYSSTNTNASSFTYLPEVTCGEDADFVPYIAVLPAGTKYVSIEATEIGQENLFGIFIIDNYLYVDNISITAASEALIMASSEDVVFPTTIVGNTKESVVDIFTAMVSNNMTATAPANFAVSSDGTTYASTATIPAAGGTLYIQYAPTTSGSHTGVVTLTDGTTSLSINVSGTAIECLAITTFPFVETFSTTSPTINCWEVVDANLDGYTFAFNYSSYNNGENAFYAFSSSNGAEDWLISPQLELGTNLMATFDVAVQSANYQERFSVYVIEEGQTYANATCVLPTQEISNTTPVTQYIDLSAYNNQTIKVAIKVESIADRYRFYVSNFQVIDAGEESLTVTPTSMTFNSIVGNPTSAQTADVTGMALSEDIAVVATAPFEVSADGNTFATTATITAGGTITTGSLYVRYNPTTAGSQTGTVTLTSGTASATISVEGSSIECAPRALPFYEDFEDELDECWQNIDNDGDGHIWRMEPVGDAHLGQGSYTSESYSGSSVLNPDNWLITPQIIIPASGAILSWWVDAQDPSYPADHYEVKISSTNSSLSSFTSVYEETIANGEWEQRSVNLNNYAGQNIYIAFVHNNCSDQFRMKIDDIYIGDEVSVENFENIVSIYPNPANTILNVNANSNIQSVEVFNMMGQKVDAIDANNTQVSINTSAYNSGMYLMRVTTENGVTNTKFTVAR